MATTSELTQALNTAQLAVLKRLTAEAQNDGTAVNALAWAQAYAALAEAKAAVAADAELPGIL